ncbi:MAG: hypothetical protein KA191_15490, partial [Verrucomicrobia bacterium]|nr:hypothetical protein [Verrucomicrobiota bacterium]HOA62009.1 hypothetical protein [Verrucomicrobiota bacterium]HOF49423.1 hypothetical protein [Verrucomicrobiota bacterium]HOG88075.1 hypothetical protein [Verrucomicrobiota bacterium]HOR72461.1 hypothetical protein [Verrucomicrobiota bacterium]
MRLPLLMRLAIGRFLPVWSCFIIAAGLMAEEARLLRFPAIHGDTVVFGYAGDLYSVPVQGGVARRLTSD